CRRAASSTPIRRAGFSTSSRRPESARPATGSPIRRISGNHRESSLAAFRVRILLLAQHEPNRRAGEIEGFAQTVDEIAAGGGGAGAGAAGGQARGRRAAFWGGGVGVA